MENSGIAVQTMIVRRICVGLDGSGQAATQRASSRGIALAKRGLRVKGMFPRGDWAGSDSNRPACSTRISCHSTEQPKVLFT